MARKDDDIEKDLNKLKKLNVGSKVKYISKTGEEKLGIVSKITKYTGCYGGLHSGRTYHNYSSVTVLLDNGRHINVSPRNLTIVNYSVIELPRIPT